MWIINQEACSAVRIAKSLKSALLLVHPTENFSNIKMPCRTSIGHEI